MEPLKLKGLGNEGNRSYFILQKEEGFKDAFNEILKKLNLFPLIHNEQGKISDFEDQVDNYKNKEIDLDVVYTKCRIIIIARANPSQLENLKSLIFAHAKMESPS